MTVLKRFMRLSMVVVVVAMMAVTAPTVAADAKPRSPVTEPYEVGLFYGTFGENPNVVLLVGGSAEEFCEANPDDPFNAAPGTATSRVSVRADGSIHVRVNDHSQPIYLYETEIEGAPPWITEVCVNYASGVGTPEPFAMGTGHLRVHDVVRSEDRIEIFNAVRGRVYGPDGATYLVRASADLVIENGAPVGDPADFVELRLRRIGR